MKSDSNPSPLYFECGMCGECCSSWQIPVDGRKAKHLLERPWVQARLAETRRELVPLSEDFYRIPLTDENVCVFLAPNRRCMVEMHEGPSLKPDECRRFPFASVRLPGGGVSHEASAACKRISEKLLLAFQPVLPRPASSAAALPDGLQGETQEADERASFDDHGLFPDEPEAVLPERIPLGWFDAIPLSRYECWRESLRAIFMRPGISPEQALREARYGLRFSESSAGALSARLPTRREDVAKACRPSGFAGLALLLFLRKPYRTFSAIQLLWGRNYHDPRVFGMPLNLREHRQIAWDASHDLLVNAFLYSVLLRRRPLACGMSLSSLLAMAFVACLLVRWHAAALAWFRGENSPARSDVSGAIRLVERYYTGHQPRFIQAFLPQFRGAFLEILLLRFSSLRRNPIFPMGRLFAR